MNNLEIKELLKSLHSTNTEFEVILTGKSKEKNTEEKLGKERGRIEKTITMLNQRLRDIVSKIEKLQEAS